MVEHCAILCYEFDSLLFLCVSAACRAALSLTGQLSDRPARACISLKWPLRSVMLLLSSFYCGDGLSFVILQGVQLNSVAALPAVHHLPLLRPEVTPWPNVSLRVCIYPRVCTDNLHVFCVF